MKGKDIGLPDTVLRQVFLTSTSRRALLKKDTFSVYITDRGVIFPVANEGRNITSFNHTGLFIVHVVPVVNGLLVYLKDIFTDIRRCNIRSLRHPICHQRLNRFTR